MEELKPDEQRLVTAFQECITLIQYYFLLSAYEAGKAWGGICGRMSSKAGMPSHLTQNQGGASEFAVSVDSVILTSGPELFDAAWISLLIGEQ